MSSPAAEEAKRPVETKQVHPAPATAHGEGSPGVMFQAGAGSDKG